MKAGGLVIGIILMCVAGYLFSTDIDIFLPIICGVLGLLITIISIGMK